MMYRNNRVIAVLSCAVTLLGCAADGDSNPNGAWPVQGGPNTGGTTAGGAGGSGVANGASGIGGAGAGGSAAMPRAGSGGSAGSTMSMTGMSGMGGAGGRAGSGGTMMTSAGSGGAPPIDTMCPAPPAGISPAALIALNTVNAARVPAGAGCATMIPEINTAATAHCNYYAMNKAMGANNCVANPHGEVMGCAGFTGANPGDRMKAAGFMGRGYSEVMAFENNPERAIASWINSVWHRLPVLDPWTTQLGYGAADRCDTIDFAPGTPAPDTTVVLYPYDGQTGLPTSFNGAYEGPMPPAPPTGWPSASPVTVYAKNMVVTEHVLTVDGSDTPIEHVWLTGMDPEHAQFLRTAVMMYGNAPFMPNTKYRVRIKGTHTGGDLNLDWTFTTGAASRFP